MQRVLPALALFVLSPLVAEFLLGNLPITALWTLPVLALLYGGGAVLIRESVRRAGRGWPSILILALAFGVLEEGIATMSLFNPNYVGLRLLDNGYIPQLGIGGPWTVLVLTLHVVWSISVPIATVEALAYTRRTDPWLGRFGLAVVALVFLLGIAVTALFSFLQSQFIASVPQVVASVVIAAALSFVGLVVVRPPSSSGPTAPEDAPSPWLVGAAALAASSAFKVLPLDWSPWLYVSLVLGLAVLSFLAIRTWSHRRGWGDAHRLALAAGPLLTYAWSSFPQPPVMPASPTEDLMGNAVFAIGAIILIVVAAARIHRRAVGASEVEHDDGAASEVDRRVTAGMG